MDANINDKKYEKIFCGLQEARQRNINQLFMNRFKIVSNVYIPYMKKTWNDQHDELSLFSQVRLFESKLVPKFLRYFNQTYYEMYFCIVSIICRGQISRLYHIHSLLTTDFG